MVVSHLVEGLGEGPLESPCLGRHCLGCPCLQGDPFLPGSHSLAHDLPIAVGCVGTRSQLDSVRGASLQVDI